MTISSTFGNNSEGLTIKWCIVGTITMIIILGIIIAIIWLVSWLNICRKKRKLMDRGDKSE